MDEDYSKGQRLFVETIDGTVEGVFHSMDPGHNKMTLKQVVLHPSGKKVDGFYHYYRNEVQCVRILEPGSYTGVDTTNEAAGNWNLMRKAESSVISNKFPGRVTTADVVMNCKPGHGYNRSVSNRKTNLSEEEYDELNELLRNFMFIDRVGDVFRKAIKVLREESAVGVGVEGAVFGRRSKFGLITIVTTKWAFIFDIHTLGDDMFKNGLRDILESKKIEKVIHNCRLVSDCLHHKHNVTIANVFDTQVGDLMVTQQNCGQFPRTVSSLPQCLTKYLHLPENLIYQPQIRSGYMVVDAMKWNKRPLPIELQSAAVKNSIYLLHLKKRIQSEMMSTFHQCVNVFVNVVRDADLQEASEHQANDTLVPQEILSFNNHTSLMIGKEVVRNGV